MGEKLDAMLDFHGMAMSGGVLDAIEHFSGTELASIQSAYRAVGFDAVAKLIGSAREALSRVDTDLDSLEEALDQAYSDAIPDDRTLIRAAQSLRE
jgi:hypothetical protein